MIDCDCWLNWSSTELSLQTRNKYENCISLLTSHLQSSLIQLPAGLIQRQSRAESLVSSSNLGGGPDLLSLFLRSYGFSSSAWGKSWSGPGDDAMACHSFPVVRKEKLGTLVDLTWKDFITSISEDWQGITSLTCQDVLLWSWSWSWRSLSILIKKKILFEYLQRKLIIFNSLAWPGLAWW